MTEFKWFVLDLNPEPWAVGPITTGRKGGRIFANMGRNQGLHAYQQAIKELIGDGHDLIIGPVELKFYFWRNRADYTTPQARTARKNEADATNMQKAAEDALQGVLFKNDKDTNHVTSKIIAQGTDVHGKILIAVRPGAFGSMLLSDVPEDVMMQVDELDAMSGPEEWTGPDDDLEM